jgi:predicted transcriptional regulator
MAQTKKPTSIRLSPEALALCAALARKLGSTRTGILEMAVRRLAEAENVQISTKLKAK